MDNNLTIRKVAHPMNNNLPIRKSVSFLDDFFEDVEEFINRSFPDFGFSDFHSFIQTPSYPITNIYVNKNKDIKVEMTVTGFSKDNIQIEAEDDGIIVKGTYDDKTSGWELIEGRIKKGSFEKRIRLTNKLDYMNAKADISNGLLTITIPPRQKFSSKQIEIK